jgi:WD40 repeat protein/serine/threonine protein kinase
MELQIGSQIKGYELQERIGAGGFGAVYRAHQSTVGREVAMKIILPDHANQPEFIRRFESEAQLIARLEHPYIVPLYDFWRDPEGAYLIMRWLRGGSLSDLLHQQGALTLEETVQILEQLAQALHTAHRSQVIHRDIKPGNILLDEDGNAYLADFGIAKDHTLAKDVTSPDAIVGSPDYLSPEQARSESVTPQTDIYSLGVVIYEMLAGQHPFPNQNPIERLYKHLNEPIPEIESLENGVRGAVNAVIQKATAKDPQQRFADAMMLAQKLREAAGLDRAPTSISLVELLTPREQEVLKLLIEGKSNREIADALVVEVATVKWYNKNIYRKLNVRSRVQAIVKARELELIVGKPAALASTSISHLPEPENPYKGLRAFQAADTRDFFGREKLTRKLISRLQEDAPYQRFLAIVGPSGSGKSSVVKAGLIPALWRGDLPGSDNWYIVDMIPGTRPLDELEVALMRAAGDQNQNLREQLERDEHGLLRVANLILPDDDSELLLVIDQFEEVFTLVDDEAARLHFLNLLSQAVTDTRSRVRVIVTLRADYYDRPLQYPDFGELIRSRIETVLPLSAEELERTVQEPAKHIGVKFEDGLVSRIVSDVNYQPGALPLLQYALTELFERREKFRLTQAAYQTIGGTGGALANRADEIFNEQDEPGRELIRQMFLRLVTLGEGAEDTRRRVERSELLDIAAEPDQMDYVIDLYADSRLLALDHDPATRKPIVEVAHEAILREWDRLRIWLNASRDDIRQERTVAQAADDWQAHHQDTSYVLRGSRLEQVEKWYETSELVLTPLEREFIEASIAQRETETQVEMKRQAREARLEQRSRNFLRGLVAVFALATIISGGFGLFALEQRQIAEANAAEAQNVALIAGSQAALANSDTDTALALAWQAVELDSDSPQAQAQLSEAAYAPGTVRLFEAHTNGVDVVDISPDERTMLSASWDGTLILWEIATGEVLRTFEGHSDQVWAAAISPDGRLAASGSVDTTAILWDLDTGNIIHRFDEFDLEVVWVEFHPDGQSLFAGGKGSAPPIIQWDVQTGDIIRRFEGHPSGVETILFTPNGDRMFSGSEDGTLILWDVQTGDIIYEINPNSDNTAGAFRVATLSPDGQSALVGYSNSIVLLLDIPTGEVLQRYSVDVGGVWAIAFHPVGDRALVGGLSGVLHMVDLQTGYLLQTFSGHVAPIFDTKIMADGRFAVSASPDGTLRMWDLGGGHVLHRFTDPQAQLFEADLSPDGRMAIAGSTEGTVTLWDVDTGAIIHQMDYDQPVLAVTFSPDGQTALIGTGYRLMEKIEPGYIILWDVETKQEIRRFEGQPNAVLDVEFNSDGTKIVAAGIGAVVILWDFETGEEIWRFEDYWENSANLNRSFMDVEFSPDGNTILAAHWDSIIHILDAESGEETGQLRGHGVGAVGIAFSEDGRRVVTGSVDSQVILWDMDTQSIIRRFTNHAAALGQVRFSPDEHFILGGSGDGTNSLWNVETGEVVRRFGGGHVQIPAFSADGRHVLVGYLNGAVELWRIDATLDKLLAWTQANRYIPELTCNQRELYRVEPFCEVDS